MNTQIKKEKEKIKKKKKKWYTVLSSAEFNKQVIAETMSSDPKSLMGRTIKVSLMNLTREIKHQNIKIIFSINSVNENNTLTEVVGYELVPSFIKRITRTGREKIDDVNIYETKDNIKLVLKLLIMTKSKTKRSILSNLRHKSKEFLTAKIQKQDYSELITSLISYALQKELKSTLSKIYPVAVCDVRVLKKIK